MEAYTDFANVYDIFMDDTPYQEWAEVLVQLIKKYGVDTREKTLKKEAYTESQQTLMKEVRLEAERRIIVDLGCGTGILTELLADAGYDMIGVDSSQDMLNVAMARREESGKNILYLNQDIRELDLYGTAGAMVSVCDCLNYLLEEEELLQVFRLVNNYLYPGGIFLFDFNTVYKYEQVIGDTTIAENREDCSFIWENFYDKESGINEYDLTIFVRCSEEEYAESGLFRQFVETHFQRGYTLEQIKRLVEQAGMKFITALDGDTHQEPREESQRILIVARESGKGR